MPKAAACRGRVTALRWLDADDGGSVLAAVEREMGRLEGYEALLCGGAPLVKAAREHCLSRGIERKRIRYEKFW